MNMTQKCDSDVISRNIFARFRKNCEESAMYDQAKFITPQKYIYICLPFSHNNSYLICKFIKFILWIDPATPNSDHILISIFCTFQKVAKSIDCNTRLERVNRDHICAFDEHWESVDAEVESCT